ncbi:MATE family efflux transporter [Teredinibacter turnerae]|uniref:MATE family efflux transporter n=1 Tax=Teredinibacter turnerae TaxID=2426 RepID=UPI0005F84737|nr:MATE family efflux transporter [Teredinibacter turnerae]
MRLNHFSFFSLPHRQAYALAWPMILSNISSPLMGMADTAMLGHLDSSLYLGSVAIGTNVLAFLFWMFNFLRMSTTSFVARAIGADDHATLLVQLGQSLLMACSLGVILLLAQGVILPFALQLMAPDTQIAALAREYLHIRLFAAPAVFVTFVLMGFFIGLQNARVPLVITFVANGLNIGLDFVFIVLNDWASAGAAWASLCAEWSACLLAVAFAWRPLKALLNKHPALSLTMLFRVQDWRNLARLNGDLLVRTSLLLLVFNFFTAQSGHLGPEILAANAILMQLVLLQSFGLDGYAHAVEAMGAKALGGRDLKRFFAACAASTFAAIALALAVTLFFAIGKQPLIAMFTDLPGVADTVSQYYGWLLFIPLVSVWTYLLDGIFIGSGHTQLMRNAMLVCVFCGFVPLWFFTRGYENHGLWLSFTTFNFLRGASLAIAFYTLTARHKWF